MDERQHTPTPWKAVKSSQFDEAEIVVGSGHAIGLMYSSDGLDESTAFPGRANAKRIVDCVHACEGMADPQATITALVTALTDLADYAGGYDEYADSGLAERIAKARAALALVPPAAGKVE